METVTAATLPSLPRGPLYDRLSPAQWRLLAAAIVAAHGAAIYGLLQVREVRDAVAEAMPLFVSIVAPPAPPKVEPPPPPPQPVSKRVDPMPRIVAAAPSPAPAPFVVPAPPPEVPEPTPLVTAPAPIVAPPAPPAPPPAPRIIPASAIQYLGPISLEYPRLSKRMGESGHVTIRVFIDEGGVAKQTQVSKSSGFPRLDEAALAAVQKARFKPPTENGVALSGWAYIPINFELEK